MGKKKEYLKAKINFKLQVSKIVWFQDYEIKNISDLYRGVSDFKKGYQPRTNIVQDEKGDGCRLPQYLARWKNYFSQLFMYVGLMMLGRQKYTQQNH
jgi:hypothetical protein